jgi:hypothetical protein
MGLACDATGLTNTGLTNTTGLTSSTLITGLTGNRLGLTGV